MTRFLAYLLVLAHPFTGHAHAARHHHGQKLTLNSTAYSACDSGTRTADGRTARFGYVAENGLPFGTRLRMLRPRRVHGRRLFVVHDRIGWGSQLDFFMPCGWVAAWGRRTVVVEVER